MVHVHHEDERVRTQEARVNQCGCSLFFILRRTYVPTRAHPRVHTHVRLLNRPVFQSPGPRIEASIFLSTLRGLLDV